MAAKIRRDDEVIVLAGKDKGKRGKVLSVVTESGRVFVEGINLIKKHQRIPGSILLALRDRWTHRKRSLSSPKKED